MQITYFSPAKINLSLDVKTKTPGADFHEIDTVFHLLDWGDQLSLEPAKSFSIEGDFDCALEDNLIYKAWQLIQKIPLNPSFEKGEAAPFFKGRTEEGFPLVRVTVKKHIPTGAGLGGGSSNAATFARAYYQLFGLGSIPEPLTAALAGLGKDIPFFLSGVKCAHGTNFGEIIEPLDFNFSGAPIYLYLPNFKHPTAWAYKQLKKFSTNYTHSLLKSGKLNDCGNSFDGLFEQKDYSDISALAKEKSIHMSGSGSAFFAFSPQKTNYSLIITKLA